MDTGARRAVAALSSIQGIGPVTIRSLEQVHGPLDVLLSAPISRWAGTVRLTSQAEESLVGVKTLAHVADRLEERARALDQQIIFHSDAAWPGGLKDWAPRVLFLRGPGAHAAPRRRVAIVGTRHPEPGVCDRVRQWAKELAQQGVGVISGAAEGVDQAAHMGALDGGGETWAFVGSAIDQLDAPQRALVPVFDQAKASIFSQYPPGTRADKSSFTRRNPLIAGAAEVVLVARAPERSGALQTAQAAIELGRPLLVAPSDPWNLGALGGNELLRQGALPCLSSADLVRALGLSTAISRVPPQGDASTLSRAAANVLGALARHASDVDALAVGCGMGADEVSAALSELEIEGFVMQKGAGHWERI
jgi:DNA protecting protein DprA